MSNLKTIEQYNAQQWREYDELRRNPPPPKPFPPTETGVACECGAELHWDRGVFYGHSPTNLGILCRTCGRRGYASASAGPKLFRLIPDDRIPK